MLARLGSWRKDHVLAVAIGLFSLALAVATFRLAATSLGGVGFGEFALARRALAIVTFPLLLGLGTSLPRFATRYRPGSGSPSPSSYAVATLLIAAPMLAIAAVAIGCFPRSFASLVFGDPRLSRLSRPTLAAIAGLYLHTLAHAFLTSNFRTVAASALQLVNSAIAPALAVVVAGGDVARALVWLGAISAVASIGAVHGLRFRHIFFTTQHVFTRIEVTRSVRDLLAFGVPRVPGEIALFGLFALPAFFVARRSGVEEAGMLSFGMSLIQLVASVFAAGAVLLMPTTGRLLAERRTDRVARLVGGALGIALASSVVLVTLMEAILGPIVLAILGPTLAAGATSARWLLLGSVPYVAYIVLRGPLDSLSAWPHSAINLGIALVIEALWMASGGTPETGMAAALLILGILMMISWHREIHRVLISAFDAEQVTRGRAFDSVSVGTRATVPGIVSCSRLRSPR